MNSERIEQAARQFIGPGPLIIKTLGNGLIHHTYKVENIGKKKTIVLQAINETAFKKPGDILHNYNVIYQYLVKHGNKIIIPEPQVSQNGQLFWVDEEKKYWRAGSFIDHSYSPEAPKDEEAAYTVAKSFASFTNTLINLDTKLLTPTIPGFHNLLLRYEQLEEAISGASLERLLKSTHVIAELRQRESLVKFYQMIGVDNAYPDRVMHHDCKISNILFNIETGEAICPVDLDTVMPGKFFSDLGDMIRSMACTVDENSIRWEDIHIRSSFYKAVLKGYLEGIGDIFTDEERNHIHYAGLMMIYMQSLRFLTDFLRGDVYYKINYPEQNLNRALNQLILLERLEAFLRAEYQFDF